MIRIGIVGYGHLGQYLTKQILESKNTQLAFVWNRTKGKLAVEIGEEYILGDLDDIHLRKVDLIVEVAHPEITKKYGEAFLKVADYMVGSPTAFADAKVERKIREAVSLHGHGVYVPSGAFWGGEDIIKMADRGTLQALRVTMRKHPSCWKLCGELKAKNDQVIDSPVTLYEGPVRALCPLAPNNVNTMAAGCLAGHNLGFDKVQGCIISDPSLHAWHVVEVDVWGPGDIQAATSFHVKTVRKNPADVGAVTGSATYASFLSSMLRANSKGPGIHIC